MMESTYIKLRNTQIDTKDLTEGYPLDDEGMMAADSSIRVYRSGPEGFTLQLRTLGSICRTKGKTRRIISTASYLGVEVLDELIESLQSIKAELQ